MLELEASCKSTYSNTDSADSKNIIELFDGYGVDTKDMQKTNSILT